MKESIAESGIVPNPPQSWAPFRGGPKRILVVLSLLGVLAILSFLGVMVLPYIMRAKDRSDRRKTTIKFWDISLGLQAYFSWEVRREYSRSHGGKFLQGRVPWQTGRLPPSVESRNVKPGDSSVQKREGESSYSCSWRYTIFPLTIGVAKFLQFDESWDSPSNQAVVNEYGSFFCSGGKATPDEPIRDATVLAITGPGTAFGDGNDPPMRFNELPPGAILVVEVRASGIPWPAPGDFDIRTMPQTINAPDGKGISGQHAGGFHVIFGDLQIWFISNDVPFETLQKFFTVAEAKKHDRETLLGPYALKRPSQQ